MKNSGLLTAVYGFFLFTVKAICLENTIPNYTVTADELSRDFSSDVKSAQVKYEGHELQVSGKVIKVLKAGSVYKVILKAGNALFSGVNCSFIKLDTDLKQTMW